MKSALQRSNRKVSSPSLHAFIQPCPFPPVRDRTDLLGAISSKLSATHRPDRLLAGRKCQKHKLHAKLWSDAQRTGIAYGRLSHLTELSNNTLLFRKEDKEKGQGLMPWRQAL